VVPLGVGHRRGVGVGGGNGRGERKRGEGEEGEELHGAWVGGQVVNAGLISLLSVWVRSLGGREARNAGDFLKLIRASTGAHAGPLITNAYHSVA
jgi:hypothetical protein